LRCTIIHQSAVNAAVDASGFDKMKKLEKSQHEMFERLTSPDSSIPFVGKDRGMKNFSHGVMG